MLCWGTGRGAEMSFISRVLVRFEGLLALQSSLLPAPGLI